MKYYSIGEFSKLTGLSTQTLRRWDESGKLKSHHKTAISGKRFYSEIQLNEFLGEKTQVIERINVGYIRVSTNHQKDDLTRQRNLMEIYLASKGEKFKIIEDIGSGINYDKTGLNELLTDIVNKKVETVFVLYKDRLVRFGFELIENLSALFGTNIEIINEENKTDEEELVEDLIQIVTTFSAGLTGNRASKSRKLLRELKNDKNSED